MDQFNNQGVLMMNLTVLGGTAYLTVVELYQTGPVNYLMGVFRCDTDIRRNCSFT